MQRPVENAPIKENDGVARLILRRCTHMSLDGQVRQELSDFRLTHLTGMTPIMKQDKTTQPVAVGFLSPPAVMQSPQSPPQLLDQPVLLRLVRLSSEMG
jgi:hypothetical protein